MLTLNIARKERNLVQLMTFFTVKGKLLLNTKQIRKGQEIMREIL